MVQEQAIAHLEKVIDQEIILPNLLCEPLRSAQPQLAPKNLCEPDTDPGPQSG
jgi:hypothetical protein